MHEKALPAFVLDSFARLYMVMPGCNPACTSGLGALYYHLCGHDSVYLHQSGVLLVSVVLAAHAVKTAGDVGKPSQWNDAPVVRYAHCDIQTYPSFCLF